MGEEMTHRKTARIAGVLWIIANGCKSNKRSILGSLNDSNYLVSISANAKSSDDRSPCVYRRYRICQHCNLAVSSSGEIVL